jgi:hypothetical protein
MNELTERLYAEGYTKDNHPESVQWSGFKEFEYTFKHLKSLVWESPCGLLSNCRDTSCLGSMSYMGIDWSYENNNPTFVCHLKKLGCELNHEVLRDRKMFSVVKCSFHLANRSYDYENSIEKLRDEAEARKDQARIAIYRKMKGYLQHIEGYSYCNNIRWHNDEDRWGARYDPSVCAQGCGYINEICLFTGREIDCSKKANVFYDLKVTRIRHEGGLFDGEKIVSITKGIKAFSSPIPVAICEEYARLCKQEVLRREQSGLSRELHFHPDTEIEILNIRAERRETKDLLQDLHDAEEGLEIVHASDLIKAKAQAKRDRKLERQEAKHRKAEKSNIENWKRWAKGEGEASKYKNLKKLAENELKKRNIDLSATKERYEQVSLF